MPTIGVFEREHQVIDAIRALRRGGSGADGLRVIVKNEQSAPLLGIIREAPLEGVAGVRETRERDERDEWNGNAPEDLAALFGPYAGTAYAVPMPNAGLSTSGAVFVPAGPWTGVADDVGNDGILADMGITAEAADACASEIRAGRYLLVAEGGDADRLAETMRRFGAVRIVP